MYHFSGFSRLYIAFLLIFLFSQRLAAMFQMRDACIHFKTLVSGIRPMSIPDFRVSAWKGEGSGFINVPPRRVCASPIS